jgi:DHA1 family tetracycline resistance protein-like MFS transporter
VKRATGAVLFMAVLVDGVGFGIVIPVLPFYAEHFGATAFQVTLLFAAYSAVQMVATPVWGRVSDRSGRRPLLIAGLFASTVSHLLYGLAGSLTMLFASRIAAGAAGGTVSVAHAYVADTTTYEDRAHYMGLVGAAAGLGFMAGPAIGGFVTRWGLGMPGYVAAGLALLNAIAALFLLPESRSREDASRAAVGETATLAGWFATMTRSPISLLMVVYFLAISSFSGMTALLALFLEGRFGADPQQVGLLFTLAGGATVVVRGLFLGRVVRRIGEKRVARIGALSLMAALAAIPLLPGTWWASAVVILYAVGAGTLFPTLATLVSFAAHRDAQGAVLGGSQVVGGLGRVTGPLWYGLLFQSVNFDSPFIVGSLLVGVSWFLAGRIPETLRPRRDLPSSGLKETVETQSVAPE